MKRRRISEATVSVHPDDAAASSSYSYDVFLNFRGADTRYNFVDCLCEFLKEAGIRVFMDDEALCVGNDIGDEVLKAMDSSRFYVPIFSRNYAASKWCLIELARMVEDRSRESEGKEILPVFLDVLPEDVNLKTGLYVEALLRHEESFGSSTVQKWRKALRTISEVKGWNWQNNQGQGKLIRQIAGHISRRLENKQRILPEHFIGIDERVQDVMNMLELGTRDVRMLVVHGMGGIGKTTLASVLFNKIRWQFQGRSFLSNIRESSMGNGIINLQNKLLHDMLGFSSYTFSDANDAMNRIQGSLQSKDVLIVLDDVNDVDQIRKLIGMGDWIGLGSRVIITTRNLNCIANVEELENDVATFQGKKIHVYHMRELYFNDAFELLSWHCFGLRMPPTSHEHLLHDILSLTGGVPLALEVVGSYLRGKGTVIWREMLNKLKKAPHSRLYQEILVSSYEMLNDEEKEIFLDIAFFFTSQDKSTAVYYWEACGFFPEMSINNLVSYALVKIDHSDRFWMHDLLRKLGKEVVRKECVDKLGRCSRLCNEDAKYSLVKNEGTKHVKALKIDSTHSHNFIPAELAGLSGLRFLELCGGNFVGRFHHSCLSELGWLSWRHCPRDFLGTNFYFDNLVVLRLLDGNVTDTWAGWEQFKTARKLKVLELQGLRLTTTPDLSSFVSLERLTFRHCASLVRIDPSVSNLECLNCLHMSKHQWEKNRIEVVDLPSSICNLKALSRIVIRGFKLKQLPENIGELKSLKIMEISWSGVLRNLPDSIGDLESLCELGLDSAGITELPESIGKLGNLKELDVRNNRLRRLPETIGKLRNLARLNVSLNRLRRLTVTIGDLEQLEVFDARWNSDLDGEIPGEFSRLQSLRSLRLTGTRIRGLPTSFVQLSRLESLVMLSCDEVQEVPELPASLIKLHISSLSLKSFPDLSSLTNLVVLTLSNRNSPTILTGKISEWIHRQQKSSPMLTLSTGLDRLSGLGHLQLSCPDPSHVVLPSGLGSLSLYHSTSLSNWERLFNLDCLSTLRLRESSATEIELDGLESLKNLAHLMVSRCEFLERVHDISRLRKLRSLRLSKCPKLVEIGGLARGPESLRHLHILQCDLFQHLPDRSDAKWPREQLHLVVYGCSKLLNYAGPYNSYFQGGKEGRDDRIVNAGASLP